VEPRKDNGLSEKGLVQAQETATQIAPLLRRSRAPVRILTSPKARCLETVTPIGLAMAVRVEVEPRLAEQRDDEDSRAMLRRLRELVKELEARAAGYQLVLCSHGDVLPLLTEMLTGRSESLKKGEWLSVSES